MIKNVSKFFSTGKQFKEALRNGSPKFGLFLNANSPVVAEQLAYSKFDWLLVDSQHGPMNHADLHSNLSAINNNGTHSLVRV